MEVTFASTPKKTKEDVPFTEYTISATGQGTLEQSLDKQAKFEADFGSEAKLKQHGRKKTFTLVFSTVEKEDAKKIYNTLLKDSD